MTKFIVITGKAGVGKTTLGKKLASKLKYAYIETSMVSKYLADELAKVKGISSNDRDSDKYMKEIRIYEDKAYLHTIVENLKLGVSVITAKVWREEYCSNEWFEKFISENNLESKQVYLINLELNDEDERKRRIMKRNHPKDKWKLDNWDKYSNQTKNYKVNWKNVYKLTLDVSFSDPDEDVKKIISFINGANQDSYSTINWENNHLVY